MIKDLVAQLDGSVIGGAMSPGMTEALLAPPPTGIDPDILMDILETSESGDFIAGLVGSMNPTGTRTMLLNSGTFIGNLLNRNTGGINPQIIVDAIHEGGSNNVLRKVWMHGCTEIVFGWVLPAMEGWTQISDARLCASPNTPVGPW